MRDLAKLRRTIRELTTPELMAAADVVTQAFWSRMRRYRENPAHVRRDCAAWTDEELEGFRQVQAMQVDQGWGDVEAAERIVQVADAELMRRDLV